MKTPNNRTERGQTAPEASSVNGTSGDFERGSRTIEKARFTGDVLDPAAEEMRRHLLKS